MPQLNTLDVEGLLAICASALEAIEEELLQGRGHTPLCRSRRDRGEQMCLPNCLLMRTTVAASGACPDHLVPSYFAVGYRFSDQGGQYVAPVEFTSPVAVWYFAAKNYDLFREVLVKDAENRTIFKIVEGEIAEAAMPLPDGFSLAEVRRMFGRGISDTPRPDLHAQQTGVAGLGDFDVTGGRTM
jgi:hypothetical protein